MVFAVAAGILIARTFKDGLLAVIGLSVVFSIIAAFFTPPLALTLIALALMAFFVYVMSKADWMGTFAPLAREEMRQDEFRRSRSAIEAE
jgi:Sec-independent protein secretion pathway component TatC